MRLQKCRAEQQLIRCALLPGHRLFSCLLSLVPRSLSCVAWHCIKSIPRIHFLKAGIWISILVGLACFADWPIGHVRWGSDPPIPVSNAWRLDFVLTAEFKHSYLSWMSTVSPLTRGQCPGFTPKRTITGPRFWIDAIWKGRRWRAASRSAARSTRSATPWWRRPGFVHLFDVCVCMYVCIYMYVCVCVFLYVYIHIYICIYVHICIYYKYICIYVYIHINIYVYIYTYICKYIYI